jgi:hypothetical protein
MSDLLSLPVVLTSTRPIAMGFYDQLAPALAFALSAAASAATASTAAAPPYDVVIRNGLLCDRSGAQPYAADDAVTG